MISRRHLLAALAAGFATGACGRGDRAEEAPSGPLRIVFMHHSLGGDPEPIQRLLRSFRDRMPGVEVASQILPSAPGTVHQYYLTALEGRTTEFDLLLLDVIWVAEFARAGWIADISEAFPPAAIARDFLPGAAEAVTVEGRTYAVPWYADVGVLYRRTDLAPDPPRTFDDLIAAARAGAAAGSVHGALWQGLQSEALVCNAYEAIWGMGGEAMRDGRLLLDTEEARAALTMLRGLIARGISPPSVTSMGEEEARRVFQAGKAVFMRNWPYAWPELGSEGSKVRGRVGLSALPSASGAPGHGALGGFQVAMNAHTPDYRRHAALGLLAHLTSREANLMLALDYGRLPARREAYAAASLRARAPMIASLVPVLEQAKPRPVTPYYPMFSGSLAAELSAAITAVRSPAEALRRAQALCDHLMRGGA